MCEKKLSQAEKFSLFQTAKKHCRCDKTTKQNFSEAEIFFPGWLVAVATLLSGPEGKIFLACETFFFAYFFGPTACALACHGFANAVTARMALGML